MENRYVLDSVAFINYFNDFFSEENILSPETRRKIDYCFDKYSFSHKLVIPAIVFVEVFRKFLKTETLVRKFYYEIFDSIKNNENIEIKPIEREVLEIFQGLNAYPMEHNDKIVYASAIQLESILITNDPVIIQYNKRQQLINSIIF